MRKNRILKEALSLSHRNEQARQWLKQHDLFNVAALCRRINYNRGAFSHFEEGHLDLSDDVLQRLEIALSMYGYDSHF